MRNQFGKTPLKGVRQQGKINYNLRLAHLDKDLIISQAQAMHNDVQKRIAELRKEGSVDEEQLMQIIAKDTDIYAEKYSYIHKNLPVAFSSLMKVADYKIDILLEMINKLHNMSVTKTGGEQVAKDIANRLHNEFTKQPNED